MYFQNLGKKILGCKRNTFDFMCHKMYAMIYFSSVFLFTHQENFLLNAVVCIFVKNKDKIHYVSSHIGGSVAARKNKMWNTFKMQSSYNVTFCLIRFPTSFFIRHRTLILGIQCESTVSQLVEITYSYSCSTS